MSNGKSGWVTFSWIIFLLAGFMNGLYGAAALVRKEYFPTEGVIYDALQSHAWVWIIIGLIQIAIALMISSRMSLGRILGIAAAVISAIVWFYYMLYMPIAGLLLIVMYVLVIYGLAATPEDFT